MNRKQPYPNVGDVWSFKLPGKSRKTKTIASIEQKDFVVKRGTFPAWRDQIASVAYVNWERQNKGRYTGITVHRLRQFGRRVSTKAERDARFAFLAERRAARDAPYTREGESK